MVGVYNQTLVLPVQIAAHTSTSGFDMRFCSGGFYGRKWVWLARLVEFTSACMRFLADGCYFAERAIYSAGRYAHRKVMSKAL